MLICHNCGAPIENRVRQCHHCQNFVSTYSAVNLTCSTVGSPLKIELETQPSVVNRVMAKELIKVAAFANGQPGNGHFGNGHSGDGHSGKGDPLIYSAEHNQFNLQTINTKPSSTLPSSTAEATLSEPLKNTDNFFLSLTAADTPTMPASSTPLDNTNTIKTPQNDKANSQSLDFFATLPDTTHETWGNKPQINIEDSTDANKAAKKEISPEPPLQSLDQPELKSQASKIPASWSNPSLEPGKSADKEEKTDILSQMSSADEKHADNKEEPADINNIHRRSFSGNFADVATNSTKNTVNNPLKNKDLASVLERMKSVFASGLRTDGSSDKGKIFGLQPWQIGLIAVIVLILLFKGFEAFCGIGSAIFSNSANPIAAKGPNLSGRWQFAAKWSNSGCNGQMVLHQNGSQIFGQGVDSQYGTYKFNGTRSSSHVDFLKQYYVGNAFVGHPIEFHGDLDTNSNPLFMSGNFSKEYMEGGKWRGRPVVVNGMWESEMVQPLIEDQTANNFGPTIRKFDERPAAAYGGFFSTLSKHGTWMAVLILGGGCFLYYLARALIGPDGWLGIWDKQKYVPAQFMREHKREKAQLSKPIVPGSLPLGQRWEWKPWLKPFFWIPRFLAIPPELRVNSPHVLILGGGEKGKSRLMAHMITHDIESADRAIVLVDSDGDLADLLLRWMSAHPQGPQLAQRTIVIDPTSNQPSPSFNPLESPDDQDLQNAASSIVHGFKAIYHEPPGSQNQWSPQTAHILRNCAMLLMANHKTLLDLPTLLQDNDFRDILLEKVEQKRKDKVEYATLLETWGQYKRLARTEQWINWYEPILNRVGPTLINQRLRPILTQPKGDINLKEIIADKKILIVKIPKGQLHADANLLGALIVTGMKQAAIALCTEGKMTDRTASMYLDEFDHFIEKETLDALTTETKKFQLGFIGATKTLQHLPEDWRNQIEANIGTMCVFALTKKDGDMLGPRMFRVSGRKAKHRTLMNIFNPINTSPQFELISDEEKYNIDRVLAQSERQFYAFRVGAEAGIFRMQSLDFNDIPDNKVDPKLIELMYKNR